MYPVSDEYLEAVQGSAREWDIQIRIVLASGEVLTVDRNDLAVGTISFTEGSTCAENIQIGSTYANSFEFGLVNTTGKYDDFNFQNAIVYPKIGLYIPSKSLFEYVPLGKFNIFDKQKRLSTIAIDCFDDMLLCNRYFQASKLTYPATFVSLFDEVVNQTGISYEPELREVLANYTFSYIKEPPAEGSTCRDILTGFGLFLRKNLRFNRAGNLEAFWYSDASRSTTAYTRVHNSQYDSEDLSIDATYLEDAYGEGHLFAPSSDLCLVELPTSPIMQDAKTCQLIARDSYELMRTVTSRSIKVTWIGDPSLQAGDIIQHINTPYGTISAPIMRRTYKFAGIDTLECFGLDSCIQQSEQQKQRRKSYTQIAKNTKAITEMELGNGELNLVVGKNGGILTTKINGEGDCASIFTKDGIEQSSLKFDFDSGQFVLKGELAAVGNSATKVKMTATGFELYNHDALIGTLRSTTSDGSISPMLILGNNYTGKNLMLKLFDNNLWLGNDAAIDQNGRFVDNESNVGILIDTQVGRVATVRGTERVYAFEAVFA